MNNFTTDRGYSRKFFERVLEKAVEETGLSGKKIELSLNLVGEGRIKALNKKYRAKNKATDVLSFPLQDKIGVKSRQNGIISLGDIFICLPVAKKYALREGVSLDFKLAFLVTHGFLHLLGYDHEKTLAESQKMFNLQDRILAELSY